MTSSFRVKNIYSFLPRETLCTKTILLSKAEYRRHLVYFEFLRTQKPPYNLGINAQRPPLKLRLWDSDDL